MGNDFSAGAPMGNGFSGGRVVMANTFSVAFPNAVGFDGGLPDGIGFPGDIPTVNNHPPVDEGRCAVCEHEGRVCQPVNCIFRQYFAPNSWNSRKDFQRCCAVYENFVAALHAIPPNETRCIVSLINQAWQIFDRRRRRAYDEIFMNLYTRFPWTRNFVPSAVKDPQERLQGLPCADCVARRRFPCPPTCIFGPLLPHERRGFALYARCVDIYGQNMARALSAVPADRQRDAVRILISCARQFGDGSCCAHDESIMASVGRLFPWLPIDGLFDDPVEDDFDDYFYGQVEHQDDLQDFPVREGVETGFAAGEVPRAFCCAVCEYKGQACTPECNFPWFFPADREGREDFAVCCLVFGEGFARRLSAVQRADRLPVHGLIIEAWSSFDDVNCTKYDHNVMKRHSRLPFFRGLPTTTTLHQLPPCAVCVHHRRACRPGCIFARYFPGGERGSMLYARCRKKYGENLAHVLSSVPDHLRHKACTLFIGCAKPGFDRSCCADDESIMTSIHFGFPWLRRYMSVAPETDEDSPLKPLSTAVFLLCLHFSITIIHRRV